jgi:anti-sigma regulatory factor (Ser/Thr protein kinase)
MPELDGIGLIRWLSECDPSLGSVLVTAAGDKKVVEVAWTAGACRFLDKPPSADDLTRVVEYAVGRTRRIRSMNRMAGDVNAVTSTHRSILRSSSALEGNGVHLVHHPLHQTGGDFLVSCTASATETLVLAADVSGHDLNAAFVASYFQGLVRGMLHRGAQLEEILEFFNKLLLEEWNFQGAENAPVSASIAVTALWIDYGAKNMVVAINGNPQPILTDAEGRSTKLARPACPLGWFPGPATHCASYGWEPGSSIRLWTDGLDELAERLAVDPLAVAFALQRARATGCGRPGWLDQAGDDIMAVSVDLCNCAEGSQAFEPLLGATYGKNESGDIDQWQAKWRRSVELALAGVSEESLFAFLLVAREVVLNALEHGCQPGESASFQAACDPQQTTLRLRVSDPGPGFERPLHLARPVCEQFGTSHRGLKLIERLARRVQSKRRGAELWIDLDLKFSPMTHEGNPH